MTTLHGRSILIVEDEQSIRSALAQVLSKEGYLVHVAKDGVEGLREANENHPDLVLLDIMMPNMDGLEFLKQARKETWGSSLPVIILTNLETDDESLSAIALYEPSYYFKKANKSLADIITTVKDILSNAPPSIA